MSTPQDDVAAGISAFRDVLVQVGDGDWDRGTPCTDWSVRDLVNHVVGGTHIFLGLLRGESLPDPARLAELRARDFLGVDALASYDEATQALREAFEAPGILERPVPSPIGTVPGAVVCQLRTTEFLVHGWDLAQALQVELTAPAEVVERSIAFTRIGLEQLPPDRSPFAAPVPVDDDAPAMSQLVALLGRTPG